MAKYRVLEKVMVNGPPREGDEFYVASLQNRRNRWVWSKIVGSVFGVHEGALNLLHDWKQSQLEKHTNMPVISSSPRRWLTPPQGWVKVNIDAAIFDTTGSMGTGCVINEAGNFIRARAQRISARMQPREAEAISLKEVLSWVKTLNYKKMCL
ncbi:uncharacterized protein LOC141711686 [Apium graveolens]|uniref:uncharacterized protein LOC141711686 n=1 Tax=Apium graveolens TaxID=4045 RepID=UPI003D796870